MYSDKRKRWKRARECLTWVHAIIMRTEKRKEQAVYKQQRRSKQTTEHEKNHAVTVSRTAVKMHKYRSDQTEGAAYTQERR